MLDPVRRNAGPLTDAGDAIEHANGLISGGAGYFRGPGLAVDLIDEQEIRKGPTDVYAQSIAHAYTCIWSFLVKKRVGRNLR